MSEKHPKDHKDKSHVSKENSFELINFVNR